MKIDVLTLFPDMFKGPFDESILHRAQEKGLAEIKIYNLRKWAKDKRGTVDDKPYGGGVGMVMMAEPIVKAIDELKNSTQNQKSKIILLSPRGKVWEQESAQEYSKLDHIILICGHYEGIDERVKKFIDGEISIGDYVLTGGELPAMVVIDSIIRLIPGVLEKPEAVQKESFTPKHLLEHPQYTHPEDFRGQKVPPVLLSGNHAEIEKWRGEEARKITRKNRPDLPR